MVDLTLYYATNRNHVGKDRWRPRSYGPKFSNDGMENLRFGRITVPADARRMQRLLDKEAGYDRGDGEALAEYLGKQVKSAHAAIRAYPESLDPGVADTDQADARLGSQPLFDDLKRAMARNTDVVVYIHGFNVAWHEAVGSALALQAMLNRSGVGDPEQQVMVMLFSWPSDGMALPFVSYKSDRSEAKGSGYAFGRGILKLRDFLMSLKRRGEPGCDQDIHLLCHSMGNYVLQNALQRMTQFAAGPVLPRMFEHIFLCAPDVPDTAFEDGQGLCRLHELSRHVSVYHNRGDLAMYVSDYTKGNPERLGTAGAARPNLIHNKVHQVDCSPLVRGLVEHSYYLWGPVNSDIGFSIDGVAFDDAVNRRRQRHTSLANVWVMG